MFTKWLPIALLVSFSCSGFAAPSALDDCQSSAGGIESNLDDISKATAGAFGGDEDGCYPTNQDITNICNETASKKFVTDDDGTQTYLYEISLKKISCVEDGETEEIAQKKVQKMWKKNGSKFKCDIAGYNLGDKNILKYAVRTTFNDFIYNIINTYKIDLSIKDPTDQKTVFEFCEDELKARKSEVPQSQIRIRDIEKTCTLLNEAKKVEK